MIIKSKLHDYKVDIQNDLCFDSFIDDPTAFFVIDRNVYDLYNEYFHKIDNHKLFLLDALEQKKTMDTVLSIVDEIVKVPAKRNAKLISIGGGITQDITGFVANIMYRGIYWLFVPTTILSAADSCIGGKTSLNYGKYKNLLGTFYPPNEIIIVPKMFKTLSSKAILSGLGEIVKFNIMSGFDYFNEISKDIDSLINCEEVSINKYIKQSLIFKRNIIEEDEFDNGKRILLNFAHTFGHAIETCSDYLIPHGTAVAIGMLVANEISWSRGLLDSNLKHDIQALLLKVINIDAANIDISKVIGAIKNDKKQVSTNIRAILMDNYFKLNIKDDLSEDEIIYAVTSIKSIL